MNKDDAKRLIEDTLQNTFSKERFLYFVKNLLNEVDESKAFHVHGYVLEIYRDFVKTYERLGTFTDPSGKKIDILIVYLHKETSIDKARTAQRNFIAQYLKDRGEKDAGLIAFVSPDGNDWRFSFVKMEYKFEETPTGKIKAKESFTPAKRYSFLVGPHEASHTAQSRMRPIILNDATNPTLEEIEDIFSVEKVTKEFFEQYKKLFLNLVDEFYKNKEFKQKVVDEHKIEVADFVKKLMGQIVFLYFLQKKGWLGVKSGEQWGSGDKRFMHNLFDRKYCEFDNYFNDILEPLFYDTLNKRDRGNSLVTNDQSYSPIFKCRIPYLNGGLFTPVYDWQRTKIYIDNKYFHDIFEVFDTFNFTVFESDPIEKEVAVDPEMLGKVFENLLEVKDRKSKGAFYTPREIVHYMCQESLINYLISKSDFPEKRIRSLMKSKDQGIARTEKQIEFIENSPELKEIASKVNTLLKEVKICDPAVGSGAFPMGLLKEISTTRFFLNKHFLKEKNKYGHMLTEYDIKKETLENCIYGVDIDPGAVEIARLRFWLSLVVEHDMEEIEPLPNLDYKIMQGNSLIELYSPTLTSKTNDDNRNKLIDQLKISRAEYFNLSDTLSKSKKREEINLLVRSLVNYDKSKQRDTIWLKIQDIRSQMGLFNDKKIAEQLNIGDVTSKEINKEFKELNKIENVSNTEHFEWHLNFSEVFEKGGFDIVIGNPPYFQLQKNKNVSIKLAPLGYATYSKSSDIYCVFYEKGIKLLCKNGILTYITSNSWMKTKYGLLLRKFVTEKTNPLILIDFNNSQIFDTAIVESNILLLKNEKYNASLKAVSYNPNDDSQTIDEYFNKNFINIINLDQNGWIIGDMKSSNLRAKLESVSIPLKDYNQKIYIGLLNGFNDAYVIDTKTRDYLVSKDTKSSEIIKPMLRGRDVTKYKYKWADLWMINPHNGIKNILPRINVERDYPVVYDYLLKFKDKLEIRKNRGSHWTNLRNCGYFQKFSFPKIIWGELSDKPKFAYDEKEFIAEATLFIMIGENLKFLLGILNSKLALWYFTQITTSSGMGTSRWKKYKIEQLPICKITSGKKTVQSKIEQLVNQIITLNQNNDTNTTMFESQIDQLIYNLYGLNEEEIKIIEKK